MYVCDPRFKKFEGGFSMYRVSKESLTTWPSPTWDIEAVPLSLSLASHANASQNIPSFSTNRTTILFGFDHIFDRRVEGSSSQTLGKKTEE